MKEARARLLIYIAHCTRVLVSQDQVIAQIIPLQYTVTHEESPSKIWSGTSRSRIDPTLTSAHPGRSAQRHLELMDGCTRS